MQRNTSHEVTTATFEEAVIRRSAEVPVVADFWAPWCGPCRTLGPILERLAAQADGAWELVKIDIDQEPELAKRFRIQSIPAVVAFRDGAPAAEFIGAQPEPMIRQFLRKLVPSEADLQATQGENLLADGDSAGAEAAFRRSLAEQPTHQRALLGLGRLLLESDPDEARKLLEHLAPNTPEGRSAAGLLGQLRFQLDARSLASVNEAESELAAHPEDISARWALAVHAAATGEYADALERFLALVEQDRRYRDDGARKAMLAIFDILGTADPAVLAFRRRLATALH